MIKKKEVAFKGEKYLIKVGREPQKSIWLDKDCYIAHIYRVIGAGKEPIKTLEFDNMDSEDSVINEIEKNLELYLKKEASKC